MNRRGFLNLLIRLSATALGGFILYPVARYLIPPRSPEAATRRVIAARKDELAPGSFKIFPFGGQPGILIRTSEGGYKAFTAVCTHLGCTVQLKAGARSIWCACHNGQYDLDGRNVSGPPPRPLEQFVVHESGNDIVVEKAQTT
jgi:Rieske Fe-S protein